MTGSPTVAMVTPWKRRGGIANYAARLVEELESTGVSVTPIPVERTDTSNPFAFGSLVDDIPSDTDVIHVQYEAGLFGRYGMSGIGAPWFFRRLGNISPAVTTTLHEVHATHGHRGPVGNALLRGRDALIERIALRASDTAVVHTREAEQVLRARHGDDIRVTRHLLPPEQNVEPTPTPEAKERFGLSGPVLLTFGWVESKKRYTDVIRALLELPDVTYFVVGDPRPGDEGAFDDAMALAADLGVDDRLVRHEYLGQEDFDDVYGAADAVVLPYRRVSVSIAVNEALSYGVPTVASSLPYFEELRDRFDCLLTYGSQAELVTALDDAIHEQETRSSLRRSADRYVDAVNWCEFAHWTRDLYADIS